MIQNAAAASVSGGERKREAPETQVTSLGGRMRSMWGPYRATAVVKTKRSAARKSKKQ